MNNCNQLNVSKIHEETNTRIYDRNIPSQMLQPYIDVRPVMTKYSYFPMFEKFLKNIGRSLKTNLQSINAIYSFLAICSKISQLIGRNC